MSAGALEVLDGAAELEDGATLLEDGANEELELFWDDGAALEAGAEDSLLPLQATTPKASNATIALQNLVFFINFPF